MSDFVKRFKQQAMGKLDSYLQGNVNRAYELGEVLGDVAAGGAAVSSAMADTLLPDSGTDLLPLGKLTKGLKGMKAAGNMSQESKELFRKTARARGMSMEETEEALRKLEAKGDPQGLARKLQAQESTQGTRAVESGADTLRQSTQKVEQLKAFSPPAQSATKTAEELARPVKVPVHRGPSAQDILKDKQSVSSEKQRRALEEDELEKRLQGI